LARDGDLWLVIGDRHDGTEWIGMDGLVTGWLRRTGWRLQARGFWLQIRSRERWDNRVNYLLRFRKRDGAPVRPSGATLCWTLPLPRSHPDSLWDAMPEPVVGVILDQSRKRGPVLDPFAGAGTTGRVAVARGRPWIGVERDPRMARVAARRLRLARVTGAPPASPAPAGAARPRRRPPRGGAAGGPRSCARSRSGRRRWSPRDPPPSRRGASAARRGRRRRSAPPRCPRCGRGAAGPRGSPRPRRRRRSRRCPRGWPAPT